MAAYIVTYDLNEEGRNRTCITKKLEAYGTHWHRQRSAWIIVSDELALDIEIGLESCLDSNDSLFVGQLTNNSAWVGYGENIAAWLVKHL